MLLIFDLDDTLVKTTEVIAPLRLRKALRKMQMAGLNIENFEKVALEISHENKTAPGSVDVLKNVWSRFGGTKDQLEEGLKELSETLLGSEVKVKKDEEVAQLILNLSKKHTLAIVTRGVVAVQEEKMSLFGIPKDVFQKVLVVEGEKKPHYAELAGANKVKENEVVVIGDRIELDLRGARELGFYTTWIKQGRGPHLGGDETLVDYTIHKLSEFSHVLEKLG